MRTKLSNRPALLVGLTQINGPHPWENHGDRVMIRHSNPFQDSGLKALLEGGRHKKPVQTPSSGVSRSPCANKRGMSQPVFNLRGFMVEIASQNPERTTNFLYNAPDP